MRVIYLGTPEFAVPTLQKLLLSKDSEVVAVVCQPDRPSGRGNKIAAPPTKVVASSHNIPVLQPERLSRAPEIVAQMKELKPDILVMVAFGQILKKEVLTMAPMGVLNLHGSLLPKYRGAAPINWAIINGESHTGNTTMFSDVGVDTGPMLLKQTVAIGCDTTAGELSTTMSAAGADLVLDTLSQLSAGTLKPEEQDSTQATFAPLLTKDMGVLKWNESASKLHNLVRGLSPWPGTSTMLDNAVVKIVSTRGHHGQKSESHKPGTLIVDSNHILVACGHDGSELLELIEVQPANKAKMKARDWVNGARLKSGTLLGTL